MLASRATHGASPARPSQMEPGLIDSNVAGLHPSPRLIMENSPHQMIFWIARLPVSCADPGFLPYVRLVFTYGFRAMPLSEFEVVHRDEHVDDCVVIAAKDGKDRVVAFIGREALEDYGGKYFNRPHLSYEQRMFLLRSDNNLAALAHIISEKYARDETSLHHGFGSTLRRVDVELADLEDGPRLEVAPLIVFDGAGYKGAGLLIG
jgi:hypothetical protein